ncbi:putative GNAT family acetyltransferase [Jackrogersella minutella]|nr:putative GNAT family acetyltransferase [Jackrogersella minutella]
MLLTLAAAEQADAARIAEIHMSAFASNAMLQAQFPTSTVRDALKKCIELKALADIDDLNTTVLVVRDFDSEHTSSDTKLDEKCCRPQARGGRAIAFAKWTHPVYTDEDDTEPPWTFPEGTDLKILEDWTRKTEDAQSYAVGIVPCYRLTFIGTDPAYERRGAATKMVRWGIEKCKKENVPAYLESTLEAAPLLGQAR